MDENRVSATETSLNKNGGSGDVPNSDTTRPPAMASRPACSCCECALAQARQVAMRSKG